MWVMTMIASPARATRRYDNAAQWLRALGDVPLDRIIFDPLPGTATEADLLRLVERDKRLCELIDGTLVEKPAGYWEGVIAARLSARLTIYCDEHGLGAVSGADSTMRMPSTGRVRLPDVAFVSIARMPKTPEPIPSLAPDLAVEVLSESNTPAEIRQKLTEYFDSGTRLAWVIDPAKRTVAVYHGASEPTRVLDEGGQLAGEEVVPGFAMGVADLFRNVPRLK
jgi:Uma2 family endonuclease